MGKFNGKKLLILGTNVGSADMVRYAKSEGAQVIVADYLPAEKSGAKQCADEVLLYSTDDADHLIPYVKRQGVNAVFAGVSEFNLQAAKRISEGAGLPFYYTDRQWNAFMNKQRFRALCDQYGVSAPKTYFAGTREQFTSDVCANIRYPVIVKPVDSAANIGISICKEHSDLEQAAESAFSKSKSGSIIVEQYVTGSEISATYVVQNGACRLVCMGTKYAYENEQGSRALANAYLYPSPVLGEYSEKADPGIQRMLLAEGIDNCTVFFQGIYSDHNFYVFEAGLRLEGTATYRICEAINGQNHMKLMIDYAMGVHPAYDLNKTSPSFDGRKAVIFSMMARQGVISRILINKQMLDDPMVYAFEQRHSIGYEMVEDGSLRQIMFRFVIIGKEMRRVADLISQIQKSFSVLDQAGNEMLIKEFQPSVLAERE